MCINNIKIGDCYLTKMVASSVASMSEMPHSMKKLPRTNSADPTTGTLMVVTTSLRSPTERDRSKYQYLTLRYVTVPLGCHCKSTFF